MLPGNHPLVNWPCIIKHADDAELTYVPDRSAWENDVELHGLDYDQTDCLVDSSGVVYVLSQQSDGRVVPEAKGVSMSLNEVLGLVKAHAAQKGSCCVAKLYAPTIDDAFRIVESLDDM